jgi:glycosyltransferase involved in cell wall biosynthesis
VGTAAGNTRNESERTTRVAVVGLTYPFRGGISHYSSLFVRALRKRYSVLFLTMCRQYPKILFPGVSQHDFSDQTLAEEGEPIVDSLNPISWFKTAQILNRERPNLIIFQWWHPFFGFAFGSIVRLLDKPLQERVCFLCHNVLPHESNIFQTVLTKYAFGKAKQFIVHSTTDRQDLERLQSSAVVRQGCHPTYSEFGSWSSMTRSEARDKLGLAADANVILFFGLIRKYKGLQYLIDAMDMLPDALECRLVIAGEFYDDKGPYLSSIVKSGLDDRVTVVDEYIPNEQVAMYFQAANVVVLPYVSATQSGIVQIAFGLGVPVITTDVGGWPEAVDHGTTGFIVDAENAEQLAGAIARYFESGVEEQFRTAIRRQTDRFDWDNEIALVEEFLGGAE